MSCFFRRLSDRLPRLFATSILSLRTLPLAGILAFACCAAGHSADWTRFQDAVTANADPAKLQLSWSPSEHQLWTAEIVGYGQSSPVTWESRVFVTSISGPKKENCHISAYDLASGKRLWQYDVAAASQAENSNYISRAAPSPAVDKSGVFCFFEGGNLLALTHDGKLRWQRNLVQEFGEIKSRHGLAASIEQADDRLFVWVERQEEPYVLAVDKGTGKDLWKVPGVGATSWSSPRLVPVTGGAHLVLSAIGSITALDPQTGKTLWKMEKISGNSTPTPVPVAENRFLIGATSGRGEQNTGNAAASNGLVAIKRNEDGSYSADYVWRAKRATCSFGSPVPHHGQAYFVNSAGVLFCLDLVTGEERYSQRLADSTWATPIALKDRVVFCGKGGTVSIVAEGPEFQKLAENVTWEPPADAPKPAAGRGFGGGPVLYAAVLVGDRLLFRRGDRLYCVGKGTN